MEWAIALLLVPSLGVYLTVVFVSELFNEWVAGIIYLLLWGIVLFGVVTSARYWHIPSTAGFLGAGLVLWYVTPSLVEPILPTLFTVLAGLMTFIALVAIGYFLVNKF